MKNIVINQNTKISVPNIILLVGVSLAFSVFVYGSFIVN